MTTEELRAAAFELMRPVARAAFDFLIGGGFGTNEQLIARWPSASWNEQFERMNISPGDIGTDAPPPSKKPLRVIGHTLTGDYQLMLDWWLLSLYAAALNRSNPTEFATSMMVYLVNHPTPMLEVRFSKFDHPTFPWPPSASWPFGESSAPKSVSLAFLFPTKGVAIPITQPFPPRSPRKWGRAWTPRWELEHAALVRQRKFARNQKKIEDDNMKLRKRRTAKSRKRRAEKKRRDRRKLLAIPKACKPPKKRRSKRKK